MGERPGPEEPEFEEEQSKPEEITDDQIREELQNLSVLGDKQIQQKIKRTLKLARAEIRDINVLKEMLGIARELEACKLEVVIGSMIEHTERNAKVVESAPRGAYQFVPEMIVLDKDKNIATVTDFQTIPDTFAYKRDDPSVRHPLEYTNPVIKIRYDNGEEKEVGVGEALVPIYDSKIRKDIAEDDPHYQQINIEARSHRYQLGDLVSFGDQIGTLAIIHSDQTVTISARVVWGKETPRYLYRAPIDQMDYIERDNGDIKKNPDGTIFKPSLE